MPTREYRTKAGKRVPSVTTVIGRFKDAGGLIHWAWTEGKEGRDYRETRQKAADVGTCAHAMVEADIHSRKFDPSEYPDEIVEAAKAPFSAYCHWKDQTRMTPVATEVWLVSEIYEFGGTMDSIMVNGELALGDWKASNSVYPDYLIQLAAYRALWEEHYPNRPLTGGFHLLRFAKDFPDFEHRFFGELELAWEQFLLYRQAYENDKILRKRVK